MAKAGFAAILWSGWTKTLVFIVIAPMIGLLVGLPALRMPGLYLAVTIPLARVLDHWERARKRSTPLIVLRHGKSDWSGGEPDRERPLAKRGRRQVPEAGAWLAANLPGA